jgi:hypothetical protein
MASDADVPPPGGSRRRTRAAAAAVKPPPVPQEELVESMVTGLPAGLYATGGDPASLSDFSALSDVPQSMPRRAAAHASGAMRRLLGCRHARMPRATCGP